VSKLSCSQRGALKKLIEDGEMWRSCTNSTLSALEKRGLAQWEVIKGRPFERWTATNAGRAAVDMPKSISHLTNPDSKC
jgi:hypothetical protein